MTNFYNIFLHFYFFNIDISFTIRVMDLKLSVCGHNNLPEGSLSQIFLLGLSFDFMIKIVNFFVIFFNMNLYISLKED